MTARHHYQACIDAWARHLEKCPHCQESVREVSRPVPCETGRACLDELRIAAQRIVNQFTPRAA